MDPIQKKNHDTFSLLPLVGGHKQPLKRSHEFTIPKKGHEIAELPVFFRFFFPLKRRNSSTSSPPQRRRCAPPSAHRCCCCVSGDHCGSVRPWGWPFRCDAHGRSACSEAPDTWANIRPGVFCFLNMEIKNDNYTLEVLGHQ